MASFGKKKTITEYLYSRPVVFLLGVLVVFLSVSVYERYTVEREMSKRKVETEREKQELIDRKIMLEERVEYLNGERGIEEEIRTHFDVAKEGEKVIILVGDKNPPAESEKSPEPEKPWYQFW
jgi:cell division protein FtsB